MDPWVIRWKDKEWRSVDQPAQVHIAVAYEYGTEGQWNAASPWNGPVALAAWLTVLFMSEIGDLEASRLLVHAMPADEFYGCLSVPED